MKKTAIRTCTVLLIATVCYVTLYFTTTRIYHGQAESLGVPGGPPTLKLIDVRIFRSMTHYRIFQPFITREEKLRTDWTKHREFYGYIHRTPEDLPPPRKN